MIGIKRNLALSKSWGREPIVTANTVTVSSDRFYAPHLQFGTKRGLPARPMLPFIGGPTSAVLAPWARAKLQKIAEQQLQKLFAPSSAGS